MLIGRLTVFDANVLADGVEALARRAGLAGEDARLVGWADVGGGDEIDEVGIVLADEDAAFIAAADDARLDGAHAAREAVIGITEVGGSADGERGAGGDEPLHEAPPRDARRLVGLRHLADDAIEVIFAGRFLFGGHIESHVVLLQIETRSSFSARSK